MYVTWLFAPLSAGSDPDYVAEVIIADSDEEEEEEEDSDNDEDGAMVFDDDDDASEGEGGESVRTYFVPIGA